MLLLTLHDGIELVDLVDDRDAISTISQLSRFDDPDVAERAFDGFPALDFLLLPLHEGLSLLVVGHEPFIFWVFGSLLDVKGQRNGLEQIAS